MDKPRKDLIFYLLRFILRSVNRRAEARQIMVELCRESGRRKRNTRKNPAETKTVSRGAPLFDGIAKGFVETSHSISAPGAVQRENI